MLCKEESKESSIKSIESVLPCFSFYQHVDNLSYNDLQIKTDFKHKIVSPYGVYNPPIPIDKMDKYEVTLKLCTVYKGVPYGPAYI